MRHIPVLLNEVLESLQLESGDNIVDCTLGDAGHSQEILKKTGPKGKLLGIDADPEAILRAKKFLSEYGDRAVLARSNFSKLTQVASDESFAPVQGILIDLGWSTPQFQDRGRGFSFTQDEPLDMRYEPQSGEETASDVVNESSATELAKIFKEYGEEKLAKEIATDIVDFRKKKKITTTGLHTEKS